MRPRTFLVVALCAAILLMAVPAVATLTGSRLSAEQARVWLRRETPCAYVDLIVAVTDGTYQSLAPRSKPFDYADLYAEQLVYDTCANQVFTHMVGSVALEPDNFSIDSLESAWLDGVTVHLRDPDLGYATSWTFTNLTWDGNDDATAWIVNGGELMPAPGVGGGPGDHHAERYVTASVVGSVLDGAGVPWLTGEHVYLAEIGTFQQTVIQP